MTFRVSVLAVVVGLAQTGPTASSDLLITNGQLIDGTGAAPRAADVRCPRAAVSCADTTDAGSE